LAQVEQGKSALDYASRTIARWAFKRRESADPKDDEKHGCTC
jgi:hypothetical protein